MNNLPIVLVLSDGDVKPNEIIASKVIIQLAIRVNNSNINFLFCLPTDIRKIPNEDDQVQMENTALTGFKYHLCTKYYETDILFVPYEKPLSTFPHHLQVSVEGLFIYFNANDVCCATTFSFSLSFHHTIFSVPSRESSSIRYRHTVTTWRKMKSNWEFCCAINSSTRKRTA